MVGTFHIVLKQEEGFDVHDTREFNLALESKFPIGRASKNQTKGYLLPAKHNVYIDSPVVSREHAILTADAASGVPQVFVTDTKSMHGTYVNGIALVPHEAKKLCNGDKLQFGVNVNRNESYFKAYKYTFNAELADPEPFSRGFTVPEAESEDEELDCIPTARGSQLNPLILDDSDAGSEPEHEENLEVAEHAEDNADVTMAHMDEEELVEIIDFAEDDNAADSVDVGMSDDSQSDVASTGSAPGYSPEPPFVYEAQHPEEAQVQNILPATLIEPTPPELCQSRSFQWSPADEQDRLPVDIFCADFESSVDPTRPAFQSPYASPWAQPTAASPEDSVAPPLPPRPSQKRQRVWGEDSQGDQTWYGARPSVPLTGDGSILAQHTFSNTETGPISTSLPAADRMQTPPHTKLPDAAPTTPTRESDVASTEVADVQPPTPTSINSRKRSADDAFEEDTDRPMEHAVMSEVKNKAPAQPAPRVDGCDDVVVPTVKEVTTSAQRPIAQPKSILRRALRAAKVMVPATALGAVFTVTALTTLPESFFTVP